VLSYCWNFHILSDCHIFSAFLIWKEVVGMAQPYASYNIHKKVWRLKVYFFVRQSYSCLEFWEFSTNPSHSLDSWLESKIIKQKFLLWLLYDKVIAIYIFRLYCQFMILCAVWIYFVQQIVNMSKRNNKHIPRKLGTATL
jgi:hypothetical protein